METGRLARYNGWWATGAVMANLLGKERKTLASLLSLMEKREPILLTGFHQVGKTTIMHQAINSLLSKGVAPKKILYFSFDTASADLDDLIRTYEGNVIGTEMNRSGPYLFLDGIQKLEGWEGKIKGYHGSHPNVKLILSGPTSPPAGKNQGERPAGKITTIHIGALTFSEFLEWRGIGISPENLETSKSELLPLFNNYLRKGGLPALVWEEDSENIREYIRSSIIERTIQKDIPERFKICDTALLKALVEMAANNPGMLLDYGSLSKELKRSRITVINHIRYLEDSLIFRTLSSYRKGSAASSRKPLKLYLGNTSIAYATVDDFDSGKFMQKAYENFAVIDTNAKNYYRNKCEVDIILKKGSRIFPIGVKHGSADKESIMRFLKESGLDWAYLFTKDSFGDFSAEGKKITEMPLWAFSLTKDEVLEKVFGDAGKNTA